VIVKALPFSIDFSTPGLRFPSEVNHSLKKDIESLSNGMNVPLAFYGMHGNNVK
jgi:hypothetical protein